MVCSGAKFVILCLVLKSVDAGWFKGAPSQSCAQVCSSNGAGNCVLSDHSAINSNDCVIAIANLFGDTCGDDGFTASANGPYLFSSGGNWLCLFANNPSALTCDSTSSGNIRYCSCDGSGGLTAGTSGTCTPPTSGGGGSGGGGTTGAGSSGDPHLRLPHGGRADFRGYHNATVSFVSSKDVALNVKTENATFKLGQTTVAGSFITEAHLAMRTHPKDSDAAFRWFNVSFWADHLNKDGWAWDLVTGSCAKAGNPPVPFQLGYHAEKRCDDLVVTTDWSSATVDTAEWRFVLRGQPVYDRLAGPRHRVDVEVTQKVADREFAVPPHGLVGQAYDGDGKPRAGRLDAYPPRHVNGTFATTAMAEGAIDGVAADYVVASPYETRFKYSAFDYPTAPAAAAAVEAKRAAMAVGDGQLRAAGAVERE